MTESNGLTGGCLCGAIRYVMLGPPVRTTVCHCSDCRRASGAPFVAWTFFRSGALKWSRGKPRQVTFANRERYFCGDCGTPIQFYDPGIPEWFEMNTCTFDDPVPHAPADVCWLSDRLPWCGPMDDLPAYGHDAPLPVQKEIS